MPIPFTIGTDYYPEHWEPSRWPVDAALMAEMGIEVVRMGEFAWSVMEPEEGDLHFAWLDEAIEILARHGIATILGTPTAAPPAWLIRKHPEILPVTHDGRRCAFGGRHHDCQSNPDYRRHVERFVTAMARHFQDNPHVLGWQIDNELGNSHQDLCYCASCERAFREWLKEKYGTVDALNEAWGTTFWSQGYRRFDEVTPPRFNVTGHNPSQILDWKRFCSDLIVDFHHCQAEIIRTYCPDHFITHNGMGFADKVDYYDLAEDLDVMAHDQYPGGHFSRDPKQREEDLAAALDLMRSVKRQPFWIMEQQSGVTGWDVMGRLPKPGELGLWAAQSVAHGADAVIFFRWRSCPFGTEQYWHGILLHDGEPGRSYHELQTFTREIKEVLRGIRGAMPEARAAIVYDYTQRYALDIQRQNAALDYYGEIMRYYRPLYRRQIACDFVPTGRDLGSYKVVLAPLHYLMDAEEAEAYRAYVEAGGTLVLTMRAGVKDHRNQNVIDGPLPGAARELCGLTVPAYDCLRSDHVDLVWEDGTRHEGVLWADLIAPENAEVLATYGSQFYAGTPAVTRRSLGKGQVFYIGTALDDAAMLHFVTTYLEPLLGGGMETPEGVEIVTRSHDKGSWTFFLNHSDEPQTIRAEAVRNELVVGAERCVREGDALTLPPHQYAVSLRRQRAE